MSLTSCHCSTPQRALAEPVNYITREGGVKDDACSRLQGRVTLSSAALRSVN